MELPRGAGVFAPVFQPVFDLAAPARQVAFFEMLMRLAGDHGGSAPGALIAFAEKRGFIAELDLEMLGIGLEWLARFPALSISANLSLDTVTHFYEEVCLQLDCASPAQRSRLIVEVTETGRPESYDGIRRGVEELRSRGVRMAVDDFGDGYADQHLLDAVLPSIIKISGPVIDDAGFVSSCVAYGQACGAEVVAERVGSEEQVARLFEQGVRFAQGYLLGMPCVDPSRWLGAAPLATEVE